MLQSLNNTSNYITWTSNLFWFFICPKLAQTTAEYLPWRTAPDEFIYPTASSDSHRRLHRRLPWPDFIADCRDNQCLAPYIVSVTHCSQLLVCPCHDTCMLTDRYQAATIPHCSGCQGSSIRGYVIRIRCLAMGTSIQPSTQHVTI
jgi:hypothetical protein